MNGHSNHLEQIDAQLVKCRRCCDVSPLEDEDALYILNAMNLNNFENVMNAMEHFLGHIDIIDSNPSFDTAASWMVGLIDRYAELDKDKEGSITLNRFNEHCEDPAERAWIDCHFDALTRAGLIHSIDSGFTVNSLKGARDIFRGLAFVQTHLPDVLKGRRALTGQLIEQFAVENAARLPTDDYFALRQLADYLKRLHARHLLGAENALANELDSLTPELLWPEESTKKKLAS